MNRIPQGLKEIAGVDAKPAWSVPMAHPLAYLSSVVELLADNLNILPASGGAVEELLHLKVPNHGKLFKALLKSYLAIE